MSFEHYFEDKENYYILLEMCKNETMNELMKRRRRLTEFEVRCYLLQLIEAMKYIHDLNIIHRDLKLKNLFLTDKMQLKIGDFGIAVKLLFEGEKKSSLCGTLNYIAPEIIEAKEGYSYEIDIWSIGVIIYGLLFGKLPFNGEDEEETHYNILNGHFELYDDRFASSAAKDLIRNLLVIDPTKRLTLDEILKHEFLCGYNIPKLLPASTLVGPPTES